MSKSDTCITALHITSEYNKYSEVKIFSTVNRRIRGDNLFRRRPSRKPLISKGTELVE